MDVPIRVAQKWPSSTEAVKLMLRTSMSGITRQWLDSYDIIVFLQSLSADTNGQYSHCSKNLKTTCQL